MNVMEYVAATSDQAKIEQIKAIRQALLAAFERTFEASEVVERDDGISVDFPGMKEITVS